MNKSTQGIVLSPQMVRMTTRGEVADNLSGLQMGYLRDYTLAVVSFALVATCLAINVVLLALVFCAIGANRLAVAKLIHDYCKKRAEKPVITGV